MRFIASTFAQWLKSGLLVVLLGASLSVHAEEPVSKSRFKGVAIGGHDTVAYHSLSSNPQQMAVGGKKSFTIEHKGAKWRFLNQGSADLFRDNPSAYEPAYNGFCANALSLGNGLVRTNGTHWEILDNKLYLFYAADGRDRWVEGDWKTKFRQQAILVRV